MSFPLLQSAAAGMDAQRRVLDVSARNVAAATAAGPKEAFTRLIPHVALIEEHGIPEAHFVGVSRQVSADADGMTEMVAVMNAARAYEADASLFGVGKQLVQRTIAMGQV
ncbi:MAG: flagellar basal body rod protein FlgC [Vulcanimicrobiaceae bacterium]